MWLGKLTDEDVHRVGCARHNESQKDQARANERDISATEEIGQTANEGTDGCEGKQVGKHL